VWLHRRRTRVGHASIFTGRTAMNNDLKEAREVLRRFAAERDWDQFHSPKNLASALAVEAAELLEHFQWLTEEQSKELSAEKKQKVAEEIADVLIYLIRLADKLDVDLFDTMRDKIAKNEKKYPVEKSRGSAKKYTEL
jgi:dCTP diphosphatase